MLIVCPSCATSYQVDAPAIGTGGRSVRCLRCQTVWFAEAPAEVPVLQQSPASLVPADADPAASNDAPNDEAVAAFQAELGGGNPPAEEAPDSGAEAPPADPETAPDTSSEAAEPQLDDAPPASESHAAEAEPEDQPAVALADIPIPIDDAPPLAPGAESDISLQSGARAIEDEPEDIESVAARRRMARASARRRSGASKARLAAVIVALGTICAVLIGLRKDIVRHAPQMASLYASIGLPVNLRGLIFTDVKVASETHDGVPVLVVEGTIISTVSVPVNVPRLRFGLRNAAGSEVYAWTAVPTQEALEPHHKLPFRSRLASPPSDSQDVQVRFFTRHDAVAGLR